MVVLINLARAAGRRRHMTAQLDASGIEFSITGVDLRQCLPAEARDIARLRFPQLRFDFDALSAAEVGCWLSHLTAWNSLLENTAQPACTVIEDDLVLAPHFGEAVEALEQHSRHDVVYLGTSSRNLSTRRVTSLGRFALHKPVGVVFNTWGYTVRRRYVERFFAADGLCIDLPIDHYVGGRARRCKPDVAVLRPPAVTEDAKLGAASQIEPYTWRVDRWRVVEEIRRRILASQVSTLYYTLYRFL